MNPPEDPFNIDIGHIGQNPNDVNYLEVDEDSDEEGDTTTETVLSESNDFNPYYPDPENPEQFNPLDFQLMPEIGHNDLDDVPDSQNGGKAKKTKAKKTKAKKAKKAKTAKKAKKAKTAKKAKKAKKAKTAKKAKKTKAKKAKK